MASIELNQPSDDSEQRLAVIVEMMREMSRHTDPQEMVRFYAERIQQIAPIDRRLGISRRGLSFPQFRITRSTTWTQTINPWKDKHQLPLMEGGLLAELLYGEEPKVFDDLTVSSHDPAAAYLAGQRSLVAIPNFDQGEALNMVVLMRAQPAAFSREQLPDMVWRSNLFGQATSNLVLRDQLQEAYRKLDREFKIVGDIQRSLLPAELPRIPTIDLAAHYQSAQRAGGDYYDFFPLPSGKLGMFIADVSGHGTPAAVMMAVTHCIAHTHPGPPTPPAAVLNYLNHHLSRNYSRLSETFVTALFGIYDPASRVFTYSSAGHNPPRLKRCQDGSLLSLDGARGLPLGIAGDTQYEETSLQLQRGDQMVLYTDGITEAQNAAGELFGAARLDRVLENCALEAQGLLNAVLRSVAEFTAGQPADDDRTIIVARCS